MVTTETPPRTTDHIDTRAPLRPRRQPKWIVGGVLAMSIGAVGAAVLWQQATGTHDVIYVAKPLAAGDVITAGDLTSVSVGRLPHVKTVSAGSLDQMIGQQALVALPSGTLLPEGVIGELPLEPGESQMGLRLSSGRLPMSGMIPGAEVVLVPLPEPAVAAGTQSPQDESLPTSMDEIPARVLTEPTRDEDGMSWLVDVAVPSSDASDVARLAAADRVAIVLAGQ